MQGAAVDAAASVKYTISEPAQPANPPPITYRGGKVMANGINIYSIFYGNHSNSTRTIVQNFIKGLGGSDWWTVSKTYTGSNGAINGNIAWVDSFNDNYSRGKNLASGSMNTIINAAVTAKKWPKDANGIYVVFVANDVAESSSNGGFCTDYCGYHGITSTNSLKFSMVGDPTRCPGTLPPPGASKGTAGCMPRYWRNHTETAYSVNKNQNGDGMLSILAHEIAETASDYANAWRDSDGEENGDKCAPYFLSVQGIGATDPYDGAFNVDFGVNGKYLIQSMWSASTQDCRLKQ
ncbi:phosphate-induced protein 1 [Zopfochytrium polystomum]|nr:phosphate-induced protein 1 [Zopfochytrium polystomum]